jgi:1-acyl-sn-glycerol-3-phosphate acyltransferase
MLWVSDDVEARMERLEIPFSDCGVDPYGISRKHVARFLTMLEPLYKSYFRVDAHGLSNVPRQGRAMLVGNHSGGFAVDAGMVIASMFFAMDPPRLAQGMVEKFLAKTPFAAMWLSRCGQFPGLPEHAVKLLEDERLLMVFPEGARGTAKLYKERYSLVNFGTGFMRLAMQTRTPIIPFGFMGGGSAVPTVTNAYGLGRALGVPYIPVTYYGVAVPLPVHLEVEYGTPLRFDGTGHEDDETIMAHVETVKSSIAALVAKGRERRAGRPTEGPADAVSAGGAA